ncbi:hypothetical protein GCM10009118_31590 [Wandonia haliotis]|uniref:T9SS type A sorting domain-containing protein n=1 Tax=Wandonia haliotis TaxID=574963 RepID=A0ABN1MTS0_9FLAO
MRKIYKRAKVFTLSLLFGAVGFNTQAQFGCGSGVVITDGFTQSGITTPGNGGVEDWNTNPTGTSIDELYWDDDVYLFEYTSGSLVEEISMTIFSRNSWNGIGIFSTCTGTEFSGELDADGTTTSNTSKTVTTIIQPSTTVYIAVGQWGSPNGLDFDVTEFTVTQIQCPNVTGITADDLSATTADISWTAGLSETSWNIQWGAPGFTPGNSEEIGSSTVTTTPAYQITGLTELTDYEIYIQADCAADGTSSWTSVFEFTTPCSPLSAPFAENFNSGLLPTCWINSSSNETTTGLWKFSESPDYDSGNTVNPGEFAWVDGSSPYVADVTLTSPIIDVSSLTMPLLSFEFFSNNTSSYLNNILTVELLEIGGSWTEIFSNNTNSSEWREISIVLSSLTSNLIQVRFIVDKTPAGSNAYYNDILLDNVSIEETPSCLHPSQLSFDDFTASTIDISWTIGNTETSWNIEWGTTGFTPGTGAEVGSDVENATPQYQITGLNPGDSYEVYIQADCGADGTSQWVGPLEVTIPISGSVCEIPLEVTTLPYNTTGSTDLYGDNYSGAPGTSCGTTGNYLNGDDVVYSYTADFDGLINVSMIPTASWSAIFVYLDCADIGSNCYAGEAAIGTAERNFDIIVNNGQTYYFVISTNAAPQSTGYEFTLTPILCPDPTDLISTNTTISSIDVSWTEGNSETNWNIQWGPNGFTPDSGDELGTDAVNGSPEYQISGLQDGTIYDIYVQADCGSGEISEWVGPIQVQTICLPMSAIGFCESFESDSETQGCWTILNENEDDNEWALYTDYANSGTYSAGLYTDYNGGDNDDWLITPELTLTGNEALSFFYRVRSSGEPNDFRVLLSTTGKNPADFDQVLMDLASYDNTAYEDTLINLSAYTGNVFIAFHVPSGGLDGYYLYIDDVCIDVCTPQASQDGELDVCILDETLNLNTVITLGENFGTWSFPSHPTLLNGAAVDVSSLPTGSYEAMYTVETFCPAEADTAYATFNIYPPSSAGDNSTVSTCNYGPFSLFDGLTGNVDLGGTWYDPSNTALQGNLVTFNGQIAANYNYYYVVSNGVCPADTAYVEIQLQDCASIAENELAGFALYPNPTSDVVNIQYSGAAINTEMILSDSKGSVILNEKVNFKTEDNYEIDMTNLVKGVYFLNIYSESGSKVIRVVRN